jgi:hypothetical protein
MLHIIPLSFFILLKLVWLLESPLNQNLRVIYQKFNGDFKIYINFGGQKENKGMMCSITLDAGCGSTIQNYLRGSLVTARSGTRAHNMIAVI